MKLLSEQNRIILKWSLIFGSFIFLTLIDQYKIVIIFVSFFVALNGMKDELK